MNKAPHYQSVLDKLNQWLRQSSEAETRTLVSGVNFLNEWIEAGLEVHRDELKHSAQFLLRDLQHFYHDYQRDTNESAYYLSLKDNIWHYLTEMTDRTQLEWREFNSDLSHEGYYKAGEEIGFGVLVCKQCSTKKEIYHPEIISACLECQHDTFYRELAKP